MSNMSLRKNREGFTLNIDNNEIGNAELTTLVQQLSQSGVTQSEIVGALKKEFTAQLQ